tara:strand:- start:894 stop:1091 length:198 start_codon:yes stop_codon:yes gene_type:complete
MKTIKIILQERIYHEYEVEADSTEEARDKVMFGIDTAGRPTEEGIKRVNYDIDECAFYDKDYEEI